jgi:hypothetical protein
VLERNAAGDVFTAAALPEWGPWPAGMLEGTSGRIGSITAPVISPEAQLEVKRRFREWRPDRPERAKDRADIELLEAAVRDHLRPSGPDA